MHSKLPTSSAVSINSALSKRQPENIGPGDRTPITAGSAAPSAPDGTSTLEIAASSTAATRVSLTSLFKLQKQFLVVNTRWCCMQNWKNKATKQHGQKKEKITKVRALLFSSTGVWLYCEHEGVLKVAGIFLCPCTSAVIALYLVREPPGSLVRH